MKIMRDLFEKQLQNLYNSELLIWYALPGMLECNERKIERNHRNLYQRKF